jgi:CheY-like chemotaxis protein
MDGFEGARQLRAESAAREARLVGVTGSLDADGRRRSAEAGLERLLIKPVAPELLEQLVVG